MEIISSCSLDNTDYWKYIENKHHPLGLLKSDNKSKCGGSTAKVSRALGRAFVQVINLDLAQNIVA